MSVGRLRVTLVGDLTQTKKIAIAELAPLVPFKSRTPWENLVI